MHIRMLLRSCVPRPYRAATQGRLTGLRDVRPPVQVQVELECAYKGASLGWRYVQFVCVSAMYSMCVACMCCLGCSDQCAPSTHWWLTLRNVVSSFDKKDSRVRKSHVALSRVDDVFVRQVYCKLRMTIRVCKLDESFNRV